MPLVQAMLQAELTALYTQMQSFPVSAEAIQVFPFVTDDEMCDRLIQAAVNFLMAGQIMTTDNAVIATYPGAYVGSGTGVLVPVDKGGKEAMALKQVCKDMKAYADGQAKQAWDGTPNVSPAKLLPDFCRQLATSWHNLVVEQQPTVMSTGMSSVTQPGTPPVPLVVPSTGTMTATITGVAAPMEATILAAFTALSTMPPQTAPAFLATQLSLAYYTYCMSCVVTAQGNLVLIPPAVSVVAPPVNGLLGTGKLL